MSKFFKTYKLSLTFALVSSALVTSCGDDLASIGNPHSEAAHKSGAVTQGVSTIAPSQLIVVISGNNSCKENMLDSSSIGDYRGVSFFNSFMDYVQTAADIWFICHQDRNEEMYLGKTSGGEIISNGMEKYRTDDISNAILQSAPVYSRISFIGYSYGGFEVLNQAIKTFPTLSSQHKQLDLFTLDAISKVSCQNPFSKGCRRSPETDFSGASLQTLGQISLWSNYYNTRGIMIRSGSFSFAKDNLPVRGFHFDVDNSEAVWDDIIAKLR